MIRRFWPLLVIAFMVGSLFRLYSDSGIGFYRMFGTLGIVVLGAMASRIVVTAQLQEGERDIKEAIAHLPDECDVWRLTRKGADRVVIGPAGAVVLLTTSVAQYARGWGLQRNLEFLRKRMKQGVQVVRRQLVREDASAVLSSHGDAAGDLRTVDVAESVDHQEDALRIHQAVVFLRREPRPEERRWLEQFGIETVSPDDVFRFLQERTVGVSSRDGGRGTVGMLAAAHTEGSSEGMDPGEIAPLR